MSKKYPSRAVIKDERHGTVPHDGNGMVGGKWAGHTHLAYKDIKLSSIVGFLDEEEAKAAIAWLTIAVGADYIRVEAYFDVGFDHSVGLENYCDLDEVFGAEEVDVNAIWACPALNIGQTEHAIENLNDLAEDENGYQLYESDL